MQDDDIDMNSKRKRTGEKKSFHLKCPIEMWHAMSIIRQANVKEIACDS